jgi:4-amino-4-deoxy-L-arabinose transferase-like glycosyltransferase
MTSSILSAPLTGESVERRQWVILAAAVFTAALVVRLACFTGLIASDDLGYAGYARQISEGTYRLEPHHYAMRYGVIVPLAVCYGLFGIHEWTTVALPLLCSSLAAALAALVAARLAGLSAAWVTGLLMVTFPVDVRYASVLVPESFLQVILLAAALLFLRAETQNSRLLGLAAGVLLGLAYLTKEPGGFVAVAFFAFALLRRQWRLAFALAAGVAFVMAGELAWYWSQSGDPLFRLHAMAVQKRSAMAVAANEGLSYRLWKAYPRMMLLPNVHFGLHSLVALGLAAIVVLRGKSFKAPWVLLLLWAILPFLYLNFGTYNLSYYRVLPPFPRYISLVYPPLFVLAAMVSLGWAGARPAPRWLVRMTLAVICVVGISCAARTRGTGYRAEHVQRLKEIAMVARRHNHQICEFGGADGIAWRRVLQIVAPDRIGCSGPAVLQLLPDADGLPMSKPRLNGTQ